MLESVCPAGSVDQRPVEGRPDVLVYTSDPLTDDLEVIGWITARLGVRSDAPSTDFIVKLIDVWPDGTALNICDGIARVPAGLLDEIRWNDVVVELGATAMRFAAGHRLRVHIQSTSFPRFDINPNTGEQARVASVQRPATQSVAIGSSHPSLVELPIPPGTSARH
jgi:putative CocE/NonD family hydrolase